MRVQSPRKRRWWRGLSAFGLLLLGLEALARFSGSTNFPIYQTDPQIGYIPAPNQSGAFLRRNTWVTNDLSMGVAQPWKPHGKRDLLLVGDSIVWGGNPIDQSERLGTFLQQDLPAWKVWPISAGSWSVENPLVWMQRHPDATKEVDWLVWIVNSVDFARASQWKSENTHPRSRPVSALFYLVDKYAWERFRAEEKENPDVFVPQVIARWKQQLAQFEKKGVQITVVCYPRKDELKHSPAFLRFRSVLLKTVPPQTHVVDLIRTPGWNSSLYLDHIHPNAPGRKKLAELLSATRH